MFRVQKGMSGKPGRLIKRGGGRLSDKAGYPI